LQDDNFMPTMTVLETCSYYATLTLPRKLSKATRQERIREVLAAMGLSHTMQTLVSISAVITIIILCWRQRSSAT
jgi:ABC-type multidrug transport system ATPase subunit